MKNEQHTISPSPQNNYSVKELTRYFAPNDIAVGDLQRKISNIADIQNINSESLDWVHKNNRDPWAYLNYSKASVVIMPLIYIDRQNEIPSGKTVIFSENPMLLLSRLARALFVEKPIPQIHASAVIHPQAIIGKEVFIGPFCLVGKCEIGDGCIIHSHVSIEDNVYIGKGVFIKNGARIGQSGFGFVKNEQNEWEKFPQLGRVVIDDSVEIGANTCIDRGALSVTRIGKGTKIDDLVQVAHNVQIGCNCVITGFVSLAGSCVIGDNVWIGPSASIKEGITIGSGAFISMGSVVINDVRDCEDVIGYPAEDKEIFVIKRAELHKMYIDRKKK